MIVDKPGPDNLLREIKDNREKVDKFRRFFRDSWDAFDGWRDDAVESYEFCGNRQWSDGDLDKRRKNQRAALTLNQMLAPVLFLTGVQRQQRQEIKVLPFEANDVRPAELMNGLVKHVGNRSDEDEVDSKVFEDKVITGMGYWKLIVDFIDSPEGELRWIRVNPLSIFPDPNFLETGWMNARFVMHAIWRDRAELLDEFPEHEDTIRQRFGEWLQFGGTQTSQLWADGMGEQIGDPFATRRQFWDPETQRARVLECWYAETKRVPVVLNVESGDVIDLPVEEREAFVEEQKAGGNRSVAIVRRPVRQVRVAKIIDDVLLDDSDSPYDSPRFPIWPATGHYFWKWPYGICEYQKDPQREFNYRRSTITDIVKRSPHGGFFNHETNGAKSDEIVNYANGISPVINHKGEPPIPIPPTSLDQSLVFLDRANKEEIRSIVNINPELLGTTTQKTVSGRAIEARQRSGLVVQEPMLDSFLKEKSAATKFLVEIIPKIMSPAQAVRILGTLAVRSPMDPTAQLVNETQPDALQELLSGAFSTKFDVIVKAQPYEPSIQVQRWEILLEMIQTFGPQAIPPDLLAEAAKNAGLIPEEWMNRIQMHGTRVLDATYPPQAPPQAAPPNGQAGPVQAPAGVTPLQ